MSRQVMVQIHGWLPGGIFSEKSIVHFNSIDTLEDDFRDIYNLPETTLVRHTYTLLLLMPCKTRAIIVGYAAGRRAEDDADWIDEWTGKLPQLPEGVDVGADIQFVWKNTD